MITFVFFRKSLQLSKLPRLDLTDDAHTAASFGRTEVPGGGSLCTSYGLAVFLWLPCRHQVLKPTTLPVLCPSRTLFPGFARAFFTCTDLRLGLDRSYFSFTVPFLARPPPNRLGFGESAGHSCAMPLQGASPFHRFILPQAPPLDYLRRVMDTSYFWTLVPAHHQTLSVCLLR